MRRPTGTEELAGRLDLHPNGVRVHLGRVRDAGLVVGKRTRQTRGRPRDMWLIAPEARPGGDAPTVRGAGALAREGDLSVPASLRAVEATGREIGCELAPEGDCAAEEKMHAVLASLGFQPGGKPMPQAG